MVKLEFIQIQHLYSCNLTVYITAKSAAQVASDFFIRYIDFITRFLMQHQRMAGAGIQHQLYFDLVTVVKHNACHTIGFGIFYRDGHCIILFVFTNFLFCKCLRLVKRHGFILVVDFDDKPAEKFITKNAVDIMTEIIF